MHLLAQLKNFSQLAGGTNQLPPASRPLNPATTTTTSAPKRFAMKPRSGLGTSAASTVSPVRVHLSFKGWAASLRPSNGPTPRAQSDRQVFLFIRSFYLQFLMSHVRAHLRSLL